MLDVGDLLDYWKKDPPVHISVALFLGIGSGKGKADATTAGVKPDEADVQSLVAMFKPGSVARNG